MKLYVQKITKDDLCRNWQCKGTLIKDSEEIFVRSNKQGRINWDKTILYLWHDLTKIKDKRQVVFTLPPYPDYLSDDKNEWPKICKATSNVTCKQGRCDCPEIKSGI